MSRDMKDRIYILRESVVKITQMLAGQGINVTQRGVSAYVTCDSKGKPTVVNLPYIPDNAKEDLINAIQGFLDHEVARVLETDFTVMNAAERSNKRAHNILKIIEDARIETAMARRFKGSASNLANTGQFFLEKYVAPKMQEASMGGDKNAMTATLLTPLLRAMSGQHVFKDFMADKMHHVDEIYSKIKGLEPELEALTSTADAYEMTKKVIKLMEMPPGGGDDEGDDDDKGGKGGAGGGKGKGGKGKGKGEPGEKGEGEDEGEEGDAGGGEGEEGEDEGEGEGEGSGKGEEEGGGEEKGKAPGKPKWDGKDDREIKLGDCAPIMEAIDKELANGFDENMSTVISNDAIRAAKNSDYLVYTKDHDVIEPLHVGKEYNAKMFTDVQDKVEHMVGPLQKDLERAISARSLATWSAGHRSGRLHAANLSRLIGGDDRVFRRKHETSSKDVAVELVIDASGSMGGEKIHLATQAAFALSSVLERLKISHEVICFTTGQPAADHATMAKERAKLGGKDFTRHESLYMPIVKGFNERINTEIKSRFGWLPNSRILRNNIDGECVEIAARRLLSRRENGKVMIVLSDGQPAGSGDYGRLHTHLQEVVRDVTKTGINVVGIGICSDAVTKYYPKHIVLNKVAELPTRVMQELRHLLIPK